jgi:hypothetical protein
METAPFGQIINASGEKNRFSNSFGLFAEGVEK